jgi:predicted RNase H-related nuclease YkuK (DUF458 family)
MDTYKLKWYVNFFQVIATCKYKSQATSSWQVSKQTNLSQLEQRMKEGANRVNLHADLDYKRAATNKVCNDNNLHYKK